MIASITHGESQAIMSHNNGVPESTICGWLRDKEKLHDFIDVVNSTDCMKRKTNQNCQNPLLDKVVFTLFVKERQAEALIRGPVLNIQAQTLPNDLHISDPSDCVEGA